MDFLYIDETGKNIFTDTGSKGFYIYGGIIINKSEVYSCLEKFKIIYQRHRALLKTILRAEVQPTEERDKLSIIRHLLYNYEVHSYYMFNKSDPQKNPWCYYDNRSKYSMAEEIIDAMIPSIEKVYFFKADRESLTKHYDEINLVGHNDRRTAIMRNSYTEEKMIEYIITEFDNWLQASNKKGTIIPDEFEANIREIFLNKMHELQSDRCWNEPIIVSSHLNAFTQVADLFTYIFMKATTSNPKKNKRFKRIYKNKIEPKTTIFELESFLVKNDSPE